jgi:hypothetical protein
MGVLPFPRRFPTMCKRTKADEADQHHCLCGWQGSRIDAACGSVVKTKSFSAAHRSLNASWTLLSPPANMILIRLLFEKYGLRRHESGKGLIDNNVAVISDLKQRAIEAGPERVVAWQVDQERSGGVIECECRTLLTSALNPNRHIRLSSYRTRASKARTRPY